ncbi:MAG TPA: hypothetical protein VIM98_17990 [Dyella sp.]|uniref:hypothetical protein n=1 Tax=Dyella sp. TaxID=1869338 RepID=UPI002F935C47
MNTSGFRRFIAYCASEWLFARWLWSLVSIIVLAIWLFHVAPFASGGAVTKGYVLETRCHRSFSYRYEYEVGGQTYTGRTTAGGMSGNGPCTLLTAGIPIYVTYLVEKPEKSLSGTVHAWTLGLMYSWGMTIFLLLFALPVARYFVRPWHARRRTAGY